MMSDIYQTNALSLFFLYSARSLKPMCTGRHVALLEHIIMTSSQLVFPDTLIFG